LKFTLVSKHHRRPALLTVNLGRASLYVVFCGVLTEQREAVVQTAAAWWRRFLWPGQQHVLWHYIALVNDITVKLITFQL